MRANTLTRNPLRTVSIVASLSSAVVNVLCAVRVIASGGSLKWDFDSEGDALDLDAVKLVWFLLAIYLAAAATASTIGFIGVAKRKLNYVRFFRDYSIIDLASVFLLAIILSYTAFSSSTLQAGVCEELARQPDLMRDMAESGLNLENCEYWFGRAAVAILGVMLVFAVVRTHFVIALSKYYAQLRRDGNYDAIHSGGISSKNEHGFQRIYLLPTPTSATFPPIDVNHQNSDNPSAIDYYHDDPETETIMVYAPVPLTRLSLEDARELHATEAWVSPVPPPSPRSHRHHRHHSHTHAHSGAKHHKRRCASISTVTSVPYRDEPESLLKEKV
ncbi:hypothetical protein BC835DRAFT_1404264 [Cytidiella melzeri]|nr:hypothetical protein BC835DRAFT_1404264 [Cytidiella melzeri]